MYQDPYGFRPSPATHAAGCLIAVFLPAIVILLVFTAIAALAVSLH